MPSVCGRADLVLALLEGGPEMLPKMASLLGYREEEEEKPTASPSDAEQKPATPAPVQEIAPEPDDEDAEETPFWRLEASIELEEEKQPEETEAAEPVVWTAQSELKPPETTPLASWRELLPKLRHVLARPVEQKALDVEMIVRKISRGEHLARIPRRRRRRWCRKLQILTDRSSRLTPFRQDQGEVTRHLKRLLPAHAVEMGACLEGPSDLRLYPGIGASIDYRPPSNGATVLVLGDLGFLAREAGFLARSWQAFGRYLSMLDCQLIVLTPCPASRRVNEVWRAIDWENRLCCGPRTSVDRARQAETLLTLLSPASRIEPGLLRAVRHLLPPREADAGTEADVWQRDELGSRSVVGATLDPDADKRFGEAFARLGDPVLKDRVLETIRTWRAKLPPEIWFQEIATLDAGSKTLLPESEVASADKYFERLPLELRDQDGGTQTDWDRSWAKSVLDRLPDHGWTPALYRLWDEVGDQNGASPPGFRPGLVGDARMPRRRLTLQQQDGLLVRAWSKDVEPGPDAGSPLGLIDSKSGQLHIEAAHRFWAAGHPPSWADDWGTDNIGPWVTFRVKGEGHFVVVQKMRWIPPGRFMMGSPEGEKGRYDDEDPRHEVTISAGFWLFDTACPQMLWQAVMGENPSHFQGADRPVEQVSFEDVERFVARLEKHVPGLMLTLPSEAQWEYACRAETETSFSFGETITTDLVNYSGRFSHEDNSEGIYRQGTVAVGSLPANAWGLHEMHGNVDEWCLDGLRDYTDQAATDPLGSTASGTERVVRGGSWLDSAQYARAAYRVRVDPGVRNGSLGFRCAGVQELAPPVGQGRGGKAERPPDPGRRGGGSLLQLDRGSESVSDAMPKASAFLVRTDCEELTFGRLTRPTWASGMGRDGFGLWASFELPLDSGRPIAQKLRWIPPGRFMMGSLETEAGRDDDEGPRHEVTISEGFWLFDTPCTQALWQAVMGENPGYFRSPGRPVEQVSFEDVQGFLDKIKPLIPGLRLTVPSEAQWEYACRAGTSAATYAGDLEIKGTRNAPALDEIAWYGGNSGVGFELENGYDSSDWPDKQYPDSPSGTRPVGKKRPNPWGLHDMLGNVWEWCADDRRHYEDQAVTDPLGSTASDAGRVVRGGSWLGIAQSARAACRVRFAPGDRNYYLGFRCAGVQEAGAKS